MHHKKVMVVIVTCVGVCVCVGERESECVNLERRGEEVGPRNDVNEEVFRRLSQLEVQHTYAPPRPMPSVKSWHYIA